MASFQDSTGRKWPLRITVNSLRRIEKEAGVKLDKIFDEGMQSVGGLFQDTERFIRAVWCLIEEDAERGPSASVRWYKPWTWLLRGLTPEEWVRHLDGGSLHEMRAAFWEAVTDFFPKHRPILNRLWAKAEGMEQGALEKAAAKVEGMTLPELAELAERNGQAAAK